VGETCCVYDDQDVVSEKEQGGRCNELVRKNQSSMLHVPGTKEFGWNLCHENKRLTPLDSRTNPS